MRDPYVYPGTNILINKYNLKNEKDLSEIEAEYTAIRLKQLFIKPLPGNYDFKHLCDFHKYIFQDIYPWAGEPRTVNIYKPEQVLGGLSIDYSNFKDIEKDAATVLTKMKKINWNDLKLPEKAEALAINMAELWKVHPFREGNTRTVVTFCNQFAKSKGIYLDVDLFINNSLYLRNSLVAAAAIFKDLGNLSKPEFLINIVKDAAEQGAKMYSQELRKSKDKEIKDYDVER